MGNEILCQERYFVLNKRSFNINKRDAASQLIEIQITNMFAHVVIDLRCKTNVDVVL